MGTIASMDPKLPSKCRDVSWPSPPTPNSKSFFQNERPESPLNYNIDIYHDNYLKIRVPETSIHDSP